jgi:hypothetical protein
LLQFNKVGDNMIKLRRTTIEDVDLLLKLDKQPSTQKYLGGIKNKTKDERILFLTKKELNLVFAYVLYIVNKSQSIICV